MSTNAKHLETRLTRIEQELAELKAAIADRRTEPWYRQIVGDFADDKAFAEIIRLGRRIRRSKVKD